MPIEEKELDEIVEPKWKKVLDGMEKGKFYSVNEMSEKIIGKRLLERDSLKEYLSARNRGKRFVATETVMAALSVYTCDVAFVLSFLATQVALGNLRQGLKNGMPYWSKK